MTYSDNTLFQTLGYWEIEWITGKEASELLALSGLRLQVLCDKGKSPV
jgi:hypothetical protein